MRGRIRSLLWPSPIQLVPVSPAAAPLHLSPQLRKTARSIAHSPALMGMQVRKNVATAATVAEEEPDRQTGVKTLLLLPELNVYRPIHHDLQRGLLAAPL